MHQRRVRPDRPPHGVADPDHALGHVAPGQRYLALADLVCPVLAHCAMLRGQAAILEGVSGDIIGRAVNAVLVPPQAERFAALAETDVSQLTLNVSGWNKLVLLDADRVFLFPRSAAGVEWFERELAAYRALAESGLNLVPRLLGRWEDPEIYPFPFAAVTRLRGAAPAAAEDLLDQLGRAIARWHELEPPALAGARPPRHHDASYHRWLRRALDPATSASAAAEAADRLARPAPRPGRTCWPGRPS